MVDELAQESFQTGKAIVTLLGKVVDKVMLNYKETHGSLKGFNDCCVSSASNAHIHFNYE